jgi:hypothetical protein
MTDFSLPPLTVDYDGRWVAVDLHGDLHEWARRAAAEVLARWGSRSGKREKQLATLLEGAGDLARRAGDASIALLLYPVLGEGVRAVVRFSPVDMSGHDGEDAWQVLLTGLIPDEPWEEPAEITEIATGAGPCRRIMRRYVTGEGSGGVRPVGEQIAYAWVFPQFGAGVVMGTAFINLQEAGMWRPVLDELAAATRLEDGR